MSKIHFFMNTDRQKHEDKIPWIKIINKLPYFRYQLQKIPEVDIVYNFGLQSKSIKQLRNISNNLKTWLENKGGGGGK